MLEMGDISGWSKTLIECSSVVYGTAEAANWAGKEALKHS
jgi:hypothetical protein